MATNTFSSKQEAQDYISRRLTNTSSYPYDEMPELIETIAKEFEIIDYPAPPRGTVGLIVARYRWVIRDEDFQIFEGILDGLKSAAGASFFMSAAALDKNVVTSAAVGLISTFYKLMKNAINKS